jgi:hypothetical protein
MIAPMRSRSLQSRELMIASESDLGTRMIEQTNRAVPTPLKFRSDVARSRPTVPRSAMGGKLSRQLWVESCH